MKQNGFTIIELMVGMAISAVILLSVVSMMFLLFSSNLRVKQSDTLEQTKYDLQNDISDSVRWASSVTVSASGEQLTVVNPDTGTTVYRLVGEQLFKNSTLMTPPDVIVSSMTIENQSANPSLAGLDITLSLAQKSFPSVQNVAHIVVSQRKIDIHIGS